MSNPKNQQVEEQNSSFIIQHSSFLLLLGAVLASVALKTWLLLADVVPFNSDEAVVALMARHILQGERPIFFYGQAYMGSLDAWLVAGAFRFFGEKVWAIRLVQTLLYLGFMYTLWLLARRFFQSPAVSGFVALVVAIPPVVVTTYTTATLGGYGESLVLGNLILLLGYEVVFGRWGQQWMAWLGLGLVGGLAFWTLGIAGVYLLPVGLVGLWNFRMRNVKYYSLSALGFVFGCSPWLYYNWIGDWEALRFLVEGTRQGLAPTTPFDRFLGLGLLGVPALIGIRFPWSSTYSPGILNAVGLVLFLGTALSLIGFTQHSVVRVRKGVWSLMGLMVGVFSVIFISTRFGVDSTGRYLLPLYAPLALATGMFIWGAYCVKPKYGILLLSMVLLFNGVQTWRAAISPEKITTQFGPLTRFDNDHDDDLIKFLFEHGETEGYTNYWVSYRLAFLTQEEIIYAPLLPYREDLRYEP
ncbi:MAG: glycosyltransferase family 39 protein, partial [Chloroflexota bacterium]|nr:glycosyltransferase family 39 protein [Chloroflexota bacterium]